MDITDREANGGMTRSVDDKQNTTKYVLLMIGNELLITTLLVNYNVTRIIP